MLRWPLPGSTPIGAYEVADYAIAAELIRH
jgi:hypothetical protein